MEHKILLVAALFMVADPGPAVAQSLAFGPTLSDEAILQRDQPITLAGSARPDSNVSVTLGDTTLAVIADGQGRWQARFAALPAATNITISAVNGAERAELKNVGVGDVFLCSGQSNMQFSMAQTALNWTERKVPIDRSIKLLTVPIASARVEKGEFDAPAHWTNAHADSADFSAVCLIAGRAIALSHNVPVGLIDASMGGTPIESWLPYEGLKQAGGMTDGLIILDAFRSDPMAAELRWGAQLDAMWTMPSPAGQERDRPRMGYANLFNAMIAPLAGTRLAGVIWYQGENNTRRANPREAYRRQLHALLESWRGRFGTKLPFVIVQLAPFGALTDQPSEDNWSELREAQRQVALEDPLAELVVTSDVGERLDIHPPMKKPVGQRAAAALVGLMSGDSTGSHGPQAIDARMDEGEVVIRIASGSAGLMAASWGRPGPFILCADNERRDCRFGDARFVDEGAAVAVTGGFLPKIVRYCWGAAPLCNVFDTQQRPLGPFELPIGAARRK